MHYSPLCRSFIVVCWHLVTKVTTDYVGAHTPTVTPIGLLWSRSTVFGLKTVELLWSVEFVWTYRRLSDSRGLNIQESAHLWWRLKSRWAFLKLAFGKLCFSFHGNISIYVMCFKCFVLKCCGTSNILTYFVPQHDKNIPFPRWRCSGRVQYRRGVSGDHRQVYVVFYDNIFYSNINVVGIFSWHSFIFLCCNRWQRIISPHRY